MRRIAALAVALLLALTVAGAARAGAPAHGVLGLHTMLYLDHPAGVRARVLDAARWAGAPLVRVDVQLNALFASGTAPVWAPLDALRRDLRRRHLRGVGVLYGTPDWLAGCGGPTPLPYRCPPRDLDAWAALVEATVRRAPEIRDWEVLNEPDVPDAFFYGGACDYARLLDRTAAAVRRARPGARVLLGGTAGPHVSWLRALQACDPDVGMRFDVGSVHVRGPVARQVRSARSGLRRIGFRGPLWVTEFGVPSAPPYGAGEVAQAAAVVAGVRSAWAAGARAVFVTARDSGEFGDASPYASEGLLRWPSLEPKPALAALANLTEP